MRSIWSGAISFGLVNIPVKLGSAIEAVSELDFDMLSKKNLAPIRYARIDTKTEKEVAWKEIVKGYQYAKGKYVVITDDDFAITETQIGRIEQVFEMLGMTARAKKCEAMDGLVKEAQNVIDEMPKGSMVIDAGLIIAGQKVEHYEIASYGSLVQLAKTMGETEIAELLQETLDEEKEADQLLTELAVSGINMGAESEPEE